MLRISYSQTDAAQQWKLCGQLAGPWVEELRACWQHARQIAAPSRAVVDLRDVTFIDELGERLLSEMGSGGADFVTAGVETKHLIENLTGKGERPLRRLVRSLSAEGRCCGESATNAKEKK